VPFFFFLPDRFGALERFAGLSQKFPGGLALVHMDGNAHALESILQAPSLPEDVHLPAGKERLRAGVPLTITFWEVVVAEVVFAEHGAPRAPEASTRDRSGDQGGSKPTHDRTTELIFEARRTTGEDSLHGPDEALGRHLSAPYRYAPTLGCFDEPRSAPYARARSLSPGVGELAPVATRSDEPSDARAGTTSQEPESCGSNALVDEVAAEFGHRSVCAHLPTHPCKCLDRGRCALSQILFVTRSR